MTLALEATARPCPARAVRIVCLSEALSPITHCAGHAGNESLLNREEVRLPDGQERAIPFLSGNMLRHVTVRAPGMRWLIQEYDLAGQLTLLQLNFLLHGGRLAGSTGREATDLVAQMRQVWPILGLLGGCLPTQIIGSMLDVSLGLLCCRENQRRLEVLLGEEIMGGLAPLLPAEAMVRPYQYATYDALSRDHDLASQTSEKGDERADSRMLYSGEAVQPGACFVHDYILHDPSPLFVGCLLWSLELWQRAGGVVGGMGAKGHGRLRTRVLASGIDVPLAIAQYQDYARAQKEAAIDWLHRAFGRSATSPAKRPARPRRKSRTTAVQSSLPGNGESSCPAEQLPFEPT
jgi:hypothetical protein